MAVELKCPECRAKLKLPITPEPDSEIECPKCGHVFAIDENRVAAGADEANEEANAPPKKKKKKASTANGDEKPAEKKAGKKAKKNAAAPADGQPEGPKKRKIKKKVTNPIVLWAVIGGAVLFLGSFMGTLIWFFTKKSTSQEMMMYLPADCDEVFGLNLGHLQKYPEFYKACETSFSTTGFSKAGDALAKVLGAEKMADVVTHIVQGTGRVGGRADGAIVEATVFKTKEEFDPSVLAKLPGAGPNTKGSANGVEYYAITPIPELLYPNLRVFAPTDRLVVFCRGDMPDAVFKAMVTGHKDDPDSTCFKRAEPLAKQVMRGTAWKFLIHNRNAPSLVPPQPSSGMMGMGGGTLDKDSPEVVFRAQMAEFVRQDSKGVGIKASVGSREVRGEFVVWYNSPDTPGEMAKKCKETEWIKDSEKDPPRYWEWLAQKTGAGKTAQNIIRDGLAFKTSGETFIIRTSMETKILTQGVGSLVGSVTGRQSGGGMMGPGAGPGGPGGPGGPPGGPGGPGGAVPGPGGGVPLPRRTGHRGYRHRRESVPIMAV